MSKRVNVEVLLGKTLVGIDNNDNEELLFRTSDGSKYRMYHSQDCCEYVRVEEIIGELDDLLNSPLTMAEEVSQECDTCSESGTWTFYKFATVKGYVTIRWLGESNGYYGEGVDFEEVTSEEE